MASLVDFPEMRISKTCDCEPSKQVVPTDKVPIRPEADVPPANHDVCNSWGSGNGGGSD